MPILSYSLRTLRHNLKVLTSLRKTHFHLSHFGSLKKDIVGKNNTVVVKKGCHLVHLTVRIRGNDNILEINENCIFGRDCSIWMEGTGIKITIGKGCTFTRICHINAQENESKIFIGNDCMFSNHIIVRTSDSHPMYDIATKQRINSPKPVVIGNHVWIAPNSKIMKGAIIADGCIIGSDTTIAKEFKEPNSLIVGRPAKVVKSNVNWTREKLF